MDTQQLKYILIFFISISFISTVGHYIVYRQDQRTKQVCFEQLKDINCFNQH